MRGGQPSTTTPMPPPCDSPKVVTRKSWPKELPMCVCHFDRGDESLNSRKRATTKPAIVLPSAVSVIPSESRGISNYFLEKPNLEMSRLRSTCQKKCAQSRVFSGERTRLRVLISAPRRNPPLPTKRSRWRVANDSMRGACAPRRSTRSESAFHLDRFEGEL